MRRTETTPATPVLPAIPVEGEPRRRFRPRSARPAPPVLPALSGAAETPPSPYRARTLPGWHGVHRAHSGYGDKALWYLPLTLTADALAAALPPAALLHRAGQPHAAAAGAAAAAAWLAVRACRRRYTAAELGERSGVTAVVADWLVLLGVLAVLLLAADEQVGAAQALAGVAAAPLVAVATRTAAHRHLVAARRCAHAVRRVLVVGEPAAADDVVGHLAARTDHAYVVVGVVPVGGARVASGAPVTTRLGPVAPSGPAEDAGIVLGAVREHRAELVLVLPGPRLSAERLRRLSWALHDALVPLAVAPGLVDVGVGRMQLDAPAGLALLHIAPPARSGAPVAVKAALDRAGAALGLLLLAPLFAVLAAAVRCSSRGPVFHRQTRHGRAGAPFTMWKFRTMVADAESRRAELEQAGGNEHDGLMFKMRRDPRITAVGRVLRRCSLDELPQLLNVLRGEMSLVGPRPPLPDEVARYDEVARRRLAVRPGITGLWQVSGRSELSWDETLAIDLRYVDNWSLAGDVDVMTRTLRAVVDGRGAY
ncbi:exopolysaccharide biosynthesis polyprenyl glycosylphosphotransferase [Actinacidiphila sp. bgisy144]|uniref:exopolysaccharide biosynthesis polyprenyl glycosylphosphotransferase n=1 Tax=Actinacidiphila sp. bgisy144 TaxID=3413791 RepID=UPI003EBD5CD0